MRTLHTLAEELLKVVSKKIPLLQHQEAAIGFLYAHKRALLADEAGLGKSRSSIEAAKFYLYKRQLLIVCPACLIPNWERQIDLWEMPRKKVVIASYERMVNHLKDLLTGRWGCVIADEAHYLKNWRAQRTKAFRKLIEKRDSAVFLLTGTPVINGAMDLHPLLSFVEPGSWGKYGDFCEEYCNKKRDQWVPGGFKYYGVKQPKLLKQKMGHIMLRRFKKDVLDDLPPKIVSKVPLKLDNALLNLFNENTTIEAALRAVEQQANNDATLAETLQELGMQKVPKVVEFVEETFKNLPIVIFAHHRLVIGALEDAFRDIGYETGVIWGRTPTDDRWQTTHAFQEGKIQRLIVSIQAGGVGIDLHRASHCVFAEFPWTQAAIDQATDRLHRIGQHSCVNAYYLYAQNTFEEPMLRAIQAKLTYMEQTVGYDRQTDD